MATVLWWNDHCTLMRWPQYNCDEMTTLLWWNVHSTLIKWPLYFDTNDIDTLSIGYIQSFHGMLLPAFKELKVLNHQYGILMNWALCNVDEMTLVHIWWNGHVATLMK